MKGVFLRHVNNVVCLGSERAMRALLRMKEKELSPLALHLHADLEKALIRSDSHWTLVASRGRHKGAKTVYVKIVPLQIIPQLPMNRIGLSFGGRLEMAWLERRIDNHRGGTKVHQSRG